MKTSILFFVPVLILSSCGGGGGKAASSCMSIGSDVNSGTVNGSYSNLGAAADGNLGTFATLNSGAPGNYISSKGNSFSGGTNAGVFITPPTGATATDITLSTFMTSDSATVESATGPTLTITKTGGDPAAEYVSFKTTAPFNGVKLQVNSAGSTQYLFFEICGAAEVH